MEAIKKIVIIGPESTGKSTLCKNLAAHYNSLWVPEYAREYLEKKGTKYSYENLLDIAKGQIALERSGVSYQCADGCCQKRAAITTQTSICRHGHVCNESLVLNLYLINATTGFSKQ